MARVAQGLQVAAVCESLPTALMGLDVIYVCGSSTDTVTRTLAAVRLPQELGWAKIVEPLRCQVHPVP